MNTKIWSVVRTLACFTFSLGMLYVCSLLASLGEYVSLCAAAALSIVVLVFANWLFDDWLLTQEDVEEDD